MMESKNTSTEREGEWIPNVEFMYKFKFECELCKAKGIKTIGHIREMVLHLRLGHKIEDLEKSIDRHLNYYHGPRHFNYPTIESLLRKMESDDVNSTQNAKSAGISNPVK